MMIRNSLCVLRTVNTEERMRLFKVARNGQVRGVDEAEQRGEYLSLEDTCKHLVVSAQTVYEIVWQVHGDATAGSKETWWWEGVEGTGYTQPVMEVE